MSRLPNVNMLVGFCGPAGSGKDTAATYFCAYHKFKRYAFADRLRRIASLAFDLPTIAFEPEYKDSRIEPITGRSPRELLQLLGTEAFRNVFGDSIWIKLLESQIFRETQERICITDVRFQNELNWLIDRGGYVIRVTREGKLRDPGIAAHISAQALELSDIPSTRIYEVNNSTTLDDLHKVLHEVFQSIQERN